MREYDVICIGTGGAGNTAAFRLASGGKRVLICDYKQFGGTCAISGCDPKKVMITAAEFADFNRRLLSKNVVDKSLELSWQHMMAHKREFTGNHSEKLKYKYEKAGIGYLTGLAVFTGRNTLKVDDEEFGFRHAVISTGSKPLRLPFPGFEYVCDNECFLNLDELPERVLFIGGGYISVEFANIASAFGAEASVIQIDDRLVPAFEPELGEVMTRSLVDRGVNVITGTRVNSVTKNDRGSYDVELSDSDGISVREVDLVVHGAGRVPRLDGLALEDAGVESARRGVTVNEYMQTTNPAVYAAGDCAATEGYMLSPIAFMEGYIAAENILNGNSKTPDYVNAGTVMFNVPALSSVGYTERQAKEAGLNYRVKFQNTDNWFTSFRSMEKYSAYKILIENDTDRILGVHIIGPHAEDVINVFVVAMKLGGRVSDLKKIIYAYPTASSDIIHMIS